MKEEIVDCKCIPFNPFLLSAGDWSFELHVVNFSVYFQLLWGVIGKLCTKKHLKLAIATAQNLKHISFYMTHHRQDSIFNPKAAFDRELRQRDQVTSRVDFC